MTRSTLPRALSRLAALLAGGLLVYGCRKPLERPRPAEEGGPTHASRVSIEQRTQLLEAELRRDASAVGAEELVAESAERRTAAVRALARIQDPRSFEALRKSLVDEAPAVIGWAAFGVGQLCRGHEPEAVRRLALRAASLNTETTTSGRDQALGSIALALGRCASDEAETTLRSWLKLRPPLAEAALWGLALVARERKRLDDASIAALLDAADKAPEVPALFAIESLPGLGPAARGRLLEVAARALAQPGQGRAFAVRALAKAGAEAAAPLGQLLEGEATSDAERADAARSLAALGPAGQSALADALSTRSRALLDGRAWLTSQHGVVLTLLEGLEPNSASPSVLAELARLPLAAEPPAIARRKIMLRCRAASLLADRASTHPDLLSCDPSPPTERHEGSLALLEVLGRGPLVKERARRFVELAQEGPPVVRETALELLIAHEEAPDIPGLLASALAAQTPGLRATAARILARYPARAQVAPADSEATRNSRATRDAKALGPPLVTDPRIVQALTEQLAQVGSSSDIELSAWLLDAAGALELLGARPALERACASPNPTLRQHAERGFARLGEARHPCPHVVGTGTWKKGPSSDIRLSFETDAGAVSVTLWGDYSPFAANRFAELARAGFYDGMLIHRVVPGFVVQLGDPDGDGFGGVDLPPLPCQLGPEPFGVGSVGVALSGRDTGLSQFFVTLRPAPHLTGEYSLVGRAEPGWERLAAGDRIIRARVLEAADK